VRSYVQNVYALVREMGEFAESARMIGLVNQEVSEGIQREIESAVISL
jgi:hypothetical protein